MSSCFPLVAASASADMHPSSSIGSPVSPVAPVSPVSHAHRAMATDSSAHGSPHHHHHHLNDNDHHHRHNDHHHHYDQHNDHHNDPDPPATQSRFFLQGKASRKWLGIALYDYDPDATVDTHADATTTHSTTDTPATTPAVLRVSAGDRLHIYRTPVDEWLWCERLTSNGKGDGDTGYLPATIVRF